MEEGSTASSDTNQSRLTNLFTHQNFSVESTKISLLPPAIQKPKTTLTQLPSSTFVASGGIAENGLHGWIITYTNDAKSTTSSLHLYSIKRDSTSSVNNKRATFQFKEDDGKDLNILTATTLVWNNLGTFLSTSIFSY